MRFRCLFSLLFLALTPLVWAQPIQVELDGRTLRFDQPPAMVGGRLMVPLRGIFEALRADVVYDGPTRSIKATKESSIVELALGSREARINGRTVYLDVPADTLGGRTMVPLRFVSEALGVEVKWQGAIKTVVMKSGAASPTPGPTTTPNDPVGDRPTLDRVIHTATRPLKAGESFDVIITGDPGGTATFELVGALKPQPLREIRAGRYETRYEIPNGLSVNQGVLVGHLRIKGQESTLEANRTVTIVGGQTAPDYSLTPSDGDQIRSERPEFRVLFPVSIRPQSVRFFLDGIDFSRQASVTENRRLSWNPQYNLTLGSHNAEVEAMSVDGKRLVKRWSFEIISAREPQAVLVEPLEGATAPTLRPRIGGVFDRDVHNLRLFVDGRDFTSQATKTKRRIFWSPPYDLSSGQHSARILGTDNRGRELENSWSFVVDPLPESKRLEEIVFNRQLAQTGDLVTVQVKAPPGATQASFNLAARANMPLTETSSGVYQGSYRVVGRDSGGYKATLRLAYPDGRILTGISSTPVFLNGSKAAPLFVSNVRNGMALPAQFRLLGTGRPGSTVSVVVRYLKPDVIGALIGRTNQFQVRGTVERSSTFDILVDASQVPPGADMLIVVTDSVRSSPIQLRVRRQ